MDRRRSVAGPSRRRWIQEAAGVATCGFFGPWKLHRAWAQSRSRKPLLIGLSTDDSGQYAVSGHDEQRGMRMAIREFNERGGVLGRRIETVQADTALERMQPTTPT